MAQSNSSYSSLARLLDGITALDAAVQVFSMNPPQCGLEAEKWALFLPYMSSSLVRDRLDYLRDNAANCQTEPVVLREVPRG